ncbi:MAG TPA: hypothetical protein VFG87_17725 [Amycolatopsis sp.]|nr:hypothetical protein [Amycolatopsis sp.]
MSYPGYGADSGYGVNTTYDPGSASGSATSFDAETVSEIANEIGQLLSDMSAFSDLAQQDPNAGKQLQTGQWINQIVADRRDGLVQHAQNLKAQFEQMCQNLQSTISALGQTDENNARNTLWAGTTGVPELRDAGDQSMRELHSDGQPEVPRGRVYPTEATSANRPESFQPAQPDSAVLLGHPLGQAIPAEPAQSLQPGVPAGFEPETPVIPAEPAQSLQPGVPAGFEPETPFMPAELVTPALPAAPNLEDLGSVSDE